MYRLNKGIAFCRVEGRPVFLDEARNRYVCLKLAAQHAFNRLFDGADLYQKDYVKFAILKDMGILTVDAIAPKLCAPILTPAVRCLEPTAKPSVKEILDALWWRLAAGLSLKFYGLQATFDKLRFLKNELSLIDDRAEDLTARLAAAFQASHYIVSANNRCLSHSIALCHQLLKRKQMAKLVIGVRLNPFSAHCWVQRSDEVVCDTAAFVRQFTPILVI